MQIQAGNIVLDRLNNPLIVKKHIVEPTIRHQGWRIVRDEIRSVVIGNLEPKNFHPEDGGKFWVKTTDERTMSEDEFTRTYKECAQEHYKVLPGVKLVHKLRPVARELVLAFEAPTIMDALEFLEKTNKGWCKSHSDMIMALYSEDEVSSFNFHQSLKKIRWETNRKLIKEAYESLLERAISAKVRKMVARWYHLCEETNHMIVSELGVDLNGFFSFVESHYNYPVTELPTFWQDALIMLLSNYQRMEEMDWDNEYPIRRYFAHGNNKATLMMDSEGEKAIALMGGRIITDIDPTSEDFLEDPDMKLVSTVDLERSACKCGQGSDMEKCGAFGTSLCIVQIS